MDQDSFRQLLQTPRPGASSNGTSRGSLLANAVKSKPANTSTGVAFKPRKVKKTTTTTAGDTYRDRAAERRTGDVNDYAEVEAVLDDFEKRTASIEDKQSVEAQRRYLGGDSVHTILVKGLDHSLMEQNRAQAELSTGVQDDDSLEQAFLASATPPDSAPKRKPTRAELVQELKSKREQGSSSQPSHEKTVLEESQQLESAKRMGKFKPIGFTPIGVPGTKRKKAKEGTVESERKKKKKRKVESQTEEQHNSQMLPPLPPAVPSVSAASVHVQPKSKMQPLPVEDFDIFGGVDDYEGIPLDDDDDDDTDDEHTINASVKEDAIPANSGATWFQTSEAELERAKNIPSIPLPVLRHNETSSESEKHSLVDEEEEDGQVTRLVPLSSSALPSIKDFLAMDKARDKPSWKGRKGVPRKGPEDDTGQEPGEQKESKPKNKGKGDKSKLSAEAKADRDYQRLKTYEEKKAGGSKHA